MSGFQCRAHSIRGINGKKTVVFDQYLVVFVPFYSSICYQVISTWNYTYNTFLVRYKVNHRFARNSNE